MPHDRIRTLPQNTRFSSDTVNGGVALFADVPRSYSTAEEFPDRRRKSNKKTKKSRNHQNQPEGEEAQDAKSLLFMSDQEETSKTNFNSLLEQPQESNHDKSPHRKMAVALGLTAIATATAGAAYSQSALPVLSTTSISELTFHLQHMEQSLQTIVASVTSTTASMSAESAMAWSGSVLDQVSQQMELLQSLLASASMETTMTLQEWKDQLLESSLSTVTTTSTTDAAAALYTSAVAELETATSALLTQIESLQLALQDQVSTWSAQMQSVSSSSKDLQDSLTTQWKTLAATLNDGETTLRTFHQDTVLPALQEAQTTVQDTVQAAQSAAQELQFRAHFQFALWDDTITTKWHEWQTTLQQLIPSQWSTAQQLAANAVQATQQVIQEQVLAMTEAVGPTSQLQDAVHTAQQSITDQAAAMTQTQVNTQIHDAVQATQQIVTDQVTMTQAQVTTQLHDLQDTAAQVTVAAQQSGIHMAAQFQEQLHESMSQVDDTVLLAANAVAAAKATADVSFSALEHWLPGYTATVQAILMERAAALSAVLGSPGSSEHTAWSQMLHHQQALVLELLFQLKSTMHAKLDAIVLSASTTDNAVLVQQMAAANAQLKILQDSLLTMNSNEVATSSKTQQALEFFTTSTQEKLVVVSMVLQPPVLLASLPIMLRNGSEPTNDVEY